MIVELDLDLTGRHDATYDWLPHGGADGELHAPPVEEYASLYGEAIPDYPKADLETVRSIFKPIAKELALKSKVFGEMIRQGADPSAPAVPRTTMEPEQWEDLKLRLPGADDPLIAFRLQPSARLGPVVLKKPPKMRKDQPPLFMGHESAAVYWMPGLRPELDRLLVDHPVEPFLFKTGSSPLVELLPRVVMDVDLVAEEPFRLTRVYGSRSPMMVLPSRETFSLFDPLIVRLKDGQGG
jgi:hypothetical protein